VTILHNERLIFIIDSSCHLHNSKCLYFNVLSNLGFHLKRAFELLP